MSTEQNEAVVLQFYKAFDNRSIDQALALLAPNFVAHRAGVPEPLNSDGFKQFGMAFYLAFANGQHRFDEVIVSGNKVVTCGTFTATHLGDFQGLPPTGKQIKLSIMHIDRVENGKIVEHWGQGDALGLMQQLGMIFLPGPALLPHILENFYSSRLRSPLEAELSTKYERNRKAISDRYADLDTELYLVTLKAGAKLIEPVRKL